ncbi:MAG: sbcc: exonuclease SbcC [Sporomusa sp.]|nr:sbcc: exonuclease SbcC [Sporomusa sp.]
MAAADKVKLAGVQRKQQFDTAEAAAKQAEETRRQVETRLGTLEAAEAQAAEAQLKAASAQLDQLLAGERLAAAARLAKELVDDAPCPVCGSCSHPHPATSGQSNDTGDLTHFEQEIAAVKEHIANLTQSLAEISKAVAAERQLLVEVGASSAGLSQQAATALAELETVRAEYIEARAAVNRVCEQLIQALHMAGQTLTGNLTADSALKQVRELTESINIQDTLAETLNKQLVSHRQEYDTCQIDINRLQRVFQEAKAELAGLTARLEAANEHLVAKKHELTAITQGIPASQLLAQIAQSLEMVRQEEGLAKESAERAAELLAAAEQAKARAETSWKEAEDRRKALQVRLTAKLAEEGFADVSAMAAAYMPASRQDEGRHLLKTYAETEQRLIAQYEQLLDALKGRNVTEAEWEQSKELMDQTEAGKNKATQERVEADKEYRDLSVKHQRWAELESMRLKVKGERDCLQALRTLLRGNVFVEFLAQEQMELVVRQASERLKQITQHRYALEINSDGGFLIRDDANGGVKRPVSTLSGGETFQTALALALALSAQIQLKGKYPLEFFFLDEGFGSLDQHALDVAMSTLEKLHIERLAIGIISHVSELKQRLQRRLIVDPAEPAGRGSRIRVEEA